MEKIIISEQEVLVDGKPRFLMKVEIGGKLSSAELYFDEAFVEFNTPFNGKNSKSLKVIINELERGIIKP